tara:strand:+ start:604 stop:783 length:180 start_codon:yes stop_codon:yes gene_type:complete
MTELELPPEEVAKLSSKEKLELAKKIIDDIMKKDFTSLNQKNTKKVVSVTNQYNEWDSL